MITLGFAQRLMIMAIARGIYVFMCRVEIEDQVLRIWEGVGGVDVQGSVQVYSQCALSFVTCIYKCVSVIQVSTIQSL